MISAFPDDFARRIQDQLGEESKLFWNALKHAAPRSGLRVNTLKINPEEFLRISPFSLQPLPWTKSGFLIPGDHEAGKHPYHTAGLYYLQEPSAMLVGEISPPRPGSIVLDLAAAPGGKTTHLASCMQGTGLLVANDPHPGRVQALSRNVERWGAVNSVVTCEAPHRLADFFGAVFDQVYVDAPCSGEGMFRISQSEMKQWSPSLVERSAALQDEILWHAARLVRPGGELIYSTCTFAPLECEGTISRFLQARNDFQIEVIPDLEGTSPGVPEWGSGLGDLSRTLRVWPHLSPGEGHFAALLKRAGGEEKPNHGNMSRITEKNNPDSGLYREFYERHINPADAPEAIHPDSPHLVQFGGRYYALPEQNLSLEGLNIIHWGWWLGTFKTKRFEPAHALAAALNPQAALDRQILPIGSRELESFLKSLPFRNEGPKGWVLVCADRFPLGWGKRVNNRIKSFLPDWLRRP